MISTPAEAGSETKKARIFISYSRRDRAFVDRLEAALNAFDIEPLIDRTEIYAFEDWWRRIEALIVQADTIVFVLSPSAVASETCLKEVEFAASLNKRFAPIVCEAVEDNAVPEPLRRLNFIFFNETEKFDERMEQLAEALRTDISWIRRHTEFGERARVWSEAGRPGPRGLLLRPPILDEAERWIASRPRDAPEPTEATQAFIAESRRASTRRRNILTGGLSAGLLLALGLAGFAYWQRAVAVAQEKLATQQRDRALLTQSRFLADLGNQQINIDDAGTGALFALEALPHVRGERPYAPEAEAALFSGRMLLQESMVLAGRAEEVHSATFSPDSRYVLIASDKAAQIRDAKSGKEIIVLAGHTGVVYHAAFSSDGRRVVTASRDKTARVWDVATGHTIIVLVGHADVVFSAAFSPDGRRVVTTSYDDSAFIWDVESGQVIAVLGQGTDASFSPDGRRVVTASGATASIWDAETGKEIASLRHENSVNGAAFDNEGRRIVTSSGSDTFVWDVETREKIMVLTGSKASRAVFSPDGKRVATASDDKTARIWDVESGKTIMVLAGHESRVSGVAFSPDGRRLVTSAGDGTARIWDVEDGTDLIEEFDPGHNDHLVRVAFSPDGKRVVTASSDKTARIFDAGTRRVIAVLNGHADSVLNAAFSPDGRRLVTASMDQTARIWDVETDKALAVLKGHYGNVISAAFSADGRKVVTSSEDWTARIWDAETGQTIVVLKNPGGYVGNHLFGSVRRAAFSPDGRRVFTASVDRVIRVWDIETANPIVVLKDDTSKSLLSTAAFSPDGRLVMTASGDTARIWDTTTGRTIAILTGHTQPLDDAAFSSDGRRVVTVSWDRTARIWDVEAGKTIAILSYSTDDHAVSAMFTFDGRRVVVGSILGTVRIWHVFPTTQSLVDDAKTMIPRCLTRGQRERAFLDPAPSAWCIEMAKWPYHTKDWKDWLNYERADANPPLPDTPDWQPWLAERETGPVATPPPSVQPSPTDDVPLSPERERALKPKDAFKECATCPEMVMVPAGSFTMGSPESEPERFSDESPQLRVTIARPFAVGKFAVTRGEFDAFVKATGHQLGDACTAWSGTESERVQGKSFRDPGFSQDHTHPAVCVNWHDATAYAAWLSKTTGKDYWLLSEAQREYVTRAGTTTPFWWGSSITPAQANYNGNYVYRGGGWQGEYRQRTVPVDSFAPNPWGLYNVHGNVWDWTDDCWYDSNSGNHGDGTPRTRSGDCSYRVVRGGAWGNDPRNLRAALRSRDATGARLNYLGFRVGRTITP